MMVVGKINDKKAEILQFQAKFQTLMVYFRYLSVNFSDHRRVSTAKLFHIMQLPKPLGHETK